MALSSFILIRGSIRRTVVSGRISIRAKYYHVTSVTTLIPARLFQSETLESLNLHVKVSKMSALNYFLPFEKNISLLNLNFWQERKSIPSTKYQESIKRRDFHFYAFVQNDNTSNAPGD